MQAPFEPLEKQRQLNRDLERINTALFEKLWADNGPIAQALSGSRLIATSYYMLINDMSNTDSMAINERRSIVNDEKNQAILIKELAALEKSQGDPEAAELIAEKKLQLQEIEVVIKYRTQLLDLAKAPSDFNFLNSNYGLALLRDSQRPDYNAKITPYFFYNDIFPAIRGLFEVGQSSQEKLILDLYTLNAQVASQRHSVQQEFSEEKLRFLNPEKSLKENYYEALSQRCARLLSVFEHDFATSPTILNRDHPIIQEVLALMRQEAKTELDRIYLHLLENLEPETRSLRGTFNQRIFLDPQENLLRKILPIPKSQKVALSLKEQLQSLVRERKDAYGKFAQGVLDFIEGKILPKDFSNILFEFSHTRRHPTDQKESISLEQISNKISVFFSGEEYSPQERYNALKTFQTLFSVQLDLQQQSMESLNLPKMK